MNPKADPVFVQPFLASDVVGLVLFVIAVVYALLWRRDREPGMGWFTLCWLATAAWFAATPLQPLGGRTIEWSPWWLLLLASFAALTFGLVDYLQLPATMRRRTLWWVLVPMTLWFALYSLPLLGLQIPRSIANLPVAVFYGALGALAWWAGGRERDAGHRIVAALLWGPPVISVGAALLRVDTPVLRFAAIVPLVVLALTLLTATLLRRRRALEAEVERRSAAEAEVRALNAGLEARVQERTAQLQAVNAEIATERDAALDRNRVLLAAQQAEARYRTLADWTPEAIAVHRDGILLYANPAAAALLGAASAQDLVGKPLLQFVPPALHDFARERVARMTQGASGEMLQMPFARLDGSTVEVETISTLIQFDGQPALYQWARDISARRAAEQRAARLTGFYAALSRTGEALVRMSDEQSLFDELCRICVEAGQADRADLIRAEGEQAWLAAQCASVSLFDQSLYPTRFSLRERPWLLTSQAILSGESFVCSDYATDPRTQVAREQGYGIGYRSLAALPLRRGGRVCGALVLFATEAGVFDEAIVELLLRMTAEVSFALDRFDLEQSRERLLAEAEAGRDRFARVFHSGAMLTSISEVADGTIIDINEEGCRRYGFRREEVLGRTLPALGVGMAPESRRVLVERLARDGRVVNQEVIFTVQGGEQRTLLVCAETINWEGRQRLLLMGNDITELRTAERVREQIRAAERANEAKTEFISRVSHELRTPLNAVLGFAQLLELPGEPLTARQHGYLQRLHDGARHLQALVDDVIDVASIEAGRLKIAQVPLELDAIVASSIALCTAAAAQARVEIVADIAGGAALLALADPTRLRQVLANLVSNGAKYNRPGGRVTVTARGAGDLVHIEVADDGLGMTQEQQQRLFTPYDRLGREGSSVAGTGIGLVLSRQLVALMGGRLAVHSVAGQGTRVQVELPRAAQPANLIGDPLDSPAPQGTGLVLYVEDEPVNQLLVQEALRSCIGVELMVAEDGAAALELARERRPDLVLLDMHLPDMSGPQWMTALSGHAATSGIPVVVLSASAMAQDVDLARASGAVEYWTKPIDIKGLRSGVRRLLATTRRPH